MNSLTLRISNGGGRKTKKVGGFSQVDVTKIFTENSGAENNTIHNFMKAETAEEQLLLLKKCLCEENVAENTNTITFLVKVFFNTEAKHPVKCFIARHITKNPNLHQPIAAALSQELTSCISAPHDTYKDYISVVTKMASCIENFQPGCAAVKMEEISLSQYLDACLRCCVDTLKTQPLSPTEKNEIFNLSHLALRLLLHIIQKVSPENVNHLDAVLNSIKSQIQELLFDEDVPMDTKSVCGILFLTIDLLEKGQDAWVYLLHPSTTDEQLTNLLSNDASQLSLLSAVASVTAMDRLQSQTVGGESALIVLCKKILDVGERCSAESIFTLGVTRTEVQISKQLDKLTDIEISLKVVDLLLTFVWGHLEHYMDSVRHLTEQMLTNIVKFCSKLQKDGDKTALTKIFTAQKSLDKSRKSYFVSLTALVNEVGAAEVSKRLDVDPIHIALKGLNQPAVQASATTILETLLQKLVREKTAQEIDDYWVKPIVRHVYDNNDLDPGVVIILENLFVKAVKLNENLIEFIKRHIHEYRRPKHVNDMKCLVILLNAVRNSGATISFSCLNLPRDEEDLWWKGIIEYEILTATALNSNEETRVLSLSLIVESPKTTEPFTAAELNFILMFVKYNINAQSPDFRQRILSIMKKCLKRLEDSFKVAQRSYIYPEFIECLRELCFNSLLPGVNYSRRCVALQLLVWCEHVTLHDTEKVWTEEYVEKLLLHLEDSYENNKALALAVLYKCPKQLLASKKYSVSLELADILKQASSLKPTDCISAAYKLDLLRTKLPDYIMAGDTCNVPDPVAFTLLRKLHAALQLELSVCQRSVVLAAVKAPMYGLLHCMVHLVTKIDVHAIATWEAWTALMRDVIRTCVAVTAGVAPVVNNSSPEGHLPMDLGGVTDHGNASGVTLEDGRQVTAQMVLLCAWRSVKEVSLLLGEISSRVLISGEDVSEGTLTADHMARIGEHFTKLLAETKHRGAFEQAYVGFTKLLTRLWRCRSPSLHGLPRRWLDDLVAGISRGRGDRAPLSVTRRGAGLPFMIQALVTTELQVNGNAKCFHDSMTTLLRLARTPNSPSDFASESEADRERSADSKSTIQNETPSDRERDTSTAACKSETDVETRTHSLNILRALFRNSALDESVASYVEEGLMVALGGFEGRTWMERNASTLLFSALMVRVFGVQRSRADTLCVRNRMTGRIFFLRYPRLYDYMLCKLAEVSADVASPVLRPALYPVLLLLARLYPSSLEGTVSNLKLTAFIPHLRACAASAVLQTRQLAARALVPLVAPDRYVEHLITTLNMVSHKISSNYCHGLLLQLTGLLNAKPDCLILKREEKKCLDDAVTNTCWILKQALGSYPCYFLTNEWIKMVNLLIWKFRYRINVFEVNQLIQRLLEELLFKDTRDTPPGKEICLKNAAYLWFIITNIFWSNYQFAYQLLTHQSYEVTLAALNHLLIVYGSLHRKEPMFDIYRLRFPWMAVFEKYEPQNDFEKCLTEKSDYRERGCQEAITQLCEVFKRSKYLECKQKALKLLTMTPNAEIYIVANKIGDDVEIGTITDDVIIKTLTDCLDSEHESLVYLYLENISEFVTKKVKKIGAKAMLDVLRTMFRFSTSDGSEASRSIVSCFILDNFQFLHALDMNGLNQEEQFELKTTMYATIVILLEDDNETLRQRISAIVTASHMCCQDGQEYIIEKSEYVYMWEIPTKAAESLRDFIKKEKEQAAMFVTFALLDFKSQVCMNDEVGDECRVFDQNEKYNIYAEESVWTDACANEIIQTCNQSRTDPTDFVLNIIKSEPYKGTIEKLCNKNVVMFEKMLNEQCGENPDVNPKIRLFIDKLKKRSVSQTRTISLWPYY